MSVSTVFLLLLIYSAGIAWAAVLPTAKFVEGGRFAKWAGFFHFINPGPFGIKEVCDRSLFSSCDLAEQDLVM